jgi:hypothetical protein
VTGTFTISKLVAALQDQCRFEAGEVPVIMLESQPFGRAARRTESSLLSPASSRSDAWLSAGPGSKAMGTR